MDAASALLLTGLISIILFFALRQVNNWYWRISERVKLQQKTNILLGKILIQSGAKYINEVMIEEIKTEKRKIVSIDEAINVFGDEKLYRIVYDTDKQ